MFQMTFLNNEMTQSNNPIVKLLHIKIIIPFETNLIRLSIYSQYLESTGNFVIV